MDTNPDSSTTPPSAERVTAPELQPEIQTIIEHSDQFTMLNHIPDAVLILDSHRQIIYANQALFELYSDLPEEQILGQRLGELLNCTYQNRASGGCGTSEQCKFCSANQAILTSLNGCRSENECRIDLKDSARALDLRVTCTPVKLANRNHSIIVIRDITDEKLRKALEQTFFHDILNTANGLQGYAELLAVSSCSELEELRFRETVPHLAKMLVDEIESHRLLLYAETQRLAVNHETFSLPALLEEVVELYLHFQTETQRNLQVHIDDALGRICTDRILLARIIGNLTKNAMEATNEHDMVTISAHGNGSELTITVHNPGAIDPAIKPNIFDRSFSTKGKGRGVGTYSVQLFAKEYLKGEVGFKSTPENGTEFWIRIPYQTAS